MTSHRTSRRSFGSLAWYFCSDINHRILGDRLAAALDVVDSPFESRHITVDDMQAVPSRAAGGVPVMDFKLHCLLNTCLGGHEAAAVKGGAGVSEGEHFIWSDVDVQPAAPLRQLHAALQRLAQQDDGAVDVFAQREFQQTGLNVGFMLLRKSPATRKLLQAVRCEMARTGGLDQNVLNRMVLAGDTHGAVVRRFPSAIWASSNAAVRHFPAQFPPF